MEQEKKIESLTDLRNEAVNLSEEIVFEKSLFGGFNKKAVSEYIKSLKENLQQADILFNERIEEYAAMSSMLTQERDKFAKMVSDNDAINSELNANIEALKSEIVGLNDKIKEMSENVLDQNEVDLYIQTLAQNDAMKIKIEEMENKSNNYDEYEVTTLKNNINQLELTVDSLNAQIQEYSRNEYLKEEYENKNTALTNNINQLEITIVDLKAQIEEYVKNEILKEDYDILANENDLIKKQYDETMTEKSILLAEKNVLSEQNKRISDALAQAEEKVRDLRETNTRIKLKTRKMMAEFETKIYECSQNHQKNIEQITDNINNALNILNYESVDIQKLITGSDEDFFIEDDETPKAETDEETSNFEFAKETNNFNFVKYIADDETKEEEKEDFES